MSKVNEKKKKVLFFQSSCYSRAPKIKALPWQLISQDRMDRRMYAHYMGSSVKVQEVLSSTNFYQCNKEINNTIIQNPKKVIKPQETSNRTLGIDPKKKNTVPHVVFTIIVKHPG